MIIPDQFIIDDLNQDIEAEFETLKQIMSSRIYDDDYRLSSLGSYAYLLGSRLVLAGKSKQGEYRHVLPIAATAEAQAFYLAEYPKDAKELEIVLPTLRETFFKKSTGPTSSTYPDRWLRGFYLSLKWWQVPDIDLLGRTSQQTLHSSSTKSVPYRYLQVKASQAVWARLPDAGEKILEAWEGMSPEKLDSLDRPFAAFIATHENGMLSMIQLGDEAGFNHEVKLALESHEKYYSSSEELRNSPEAWFSLPALGLCALALHRGMKVNIESRFLPLDLISI